MGIFRQSSRFYHVHRITWLVPFTRVVRGEYRCWLGDTILVEDKGKQILAVASAVKTESPLRLFVRGLLTILRRPFLLTGLQRNFLTVERRATLVSQFRGDVVV